MAVKIKGTFKKDTKEFDGLGAISEEIVANPLRRVMVIAELEVETFETDVKGGGIRTPKMAPISMEVMTGDDLVTARKLRDAAYNERTGQTAPPPSLFDDGVPGTDAATHDSETTGSDAPPWDERKGDENTNPPAPDEVAAKRGRRK